MSSSGTRRLSVLRGMRGGDWNDYYTSTWPHPTAGYGNPTDGDDIDGFRVARYS